MAPDAASDTSSTFPAADVETTLNPGQNKNFKVDSVSSDIAVSKEIMEREAAREKKKEREKKEAMQTLKTTILVSAVIVAVAGAAFAIAKKLKEK